MKLKAEFPDALQCLFKPARYKVLYGGRGGAKTWGVARALLISGAHEKLRILCARELQNSIADSVHRVLADQVRTLGLDSFYEVQQASIKGCNGTEFLFEGLKHNVTKIKSYEGADRCWVEEAQTVSSSSWEVLIPTIRKDKSEIWITFNPQLEEDETYQRFVVNPPPDAIVRKVNWSDNPWFPDVLRKEMDTLRERDPDAYLNIYEGHCRAALEGAIYAIELRKATETGRITKVPYNPAMPVHTFWDLGRADMTAIWFVQTAGFEHHLIDYLEDHGKWIGDYLKTMQARGYVYGDDYLPHDGRNETLGAQKSIERQLLDAGRRVRIVPSLPVHDGINAARTLLPNCWFDERKCADGLHALRHYQYKVHPETGQRSKEPLHDFASHGADAFRYFAVAINEPQRKREDARRRRAGPANWMAA